jgi:hypothetical protein
MEVRSDTSEQDSFARCKSLPEHGEDFRERDKHISTNNNASSHDARRLPHRSAGRVSDRAPNLGETAPPQLPTKCTPRPWRRKQSSEEARGGAAA